jgi:hypothetical protein
MKNGRYTGSIPGWRIELRIASDQPSSIGLVSGDLIEVDAVRHETYQLSFSVSADRLLSIPGATVAGIPAAASVRYRSLVLTLHPLTEESARLEILLRSKSSNPPQPLSFEIQRQGAELRQLKIQPLVVPSAEPPDSPNLAAVKIEASTTAPPPITSVVDSLKRAGIACSIESSASLPTAGAGADALWSMAELASAAEAVAENPQTRSADNWSIPFLVTSRFEEPGVLGLMFHPDHHTNTGSLSAVFYNEIAQHRKVKNKPIKQAREYLFTTVHELGHVLGLPHSWEALGPDSTTGRDASALSFMNYPDLFNLGYSRFYRNFPYEFRPEEQSFLHHAPWSEIWPGRHEAEPDEIRLRGSHSNLLLELRSPLGQSVTLGEPVQLEVKLSNRSHRRARVPGNVLDPRSGHLRIIITRCGDAQKAHRFRPLAQVSQYSGHRFLGSATAECGVPASMYEIVDLTYGCAGFTFLNPGEYDLIAVAQVSSTSHVRSQPLRLEITSAPIDSASTVRNLFNPVVGRAFVLGLNPHSSIVDTLRNIGEQSFLPAAAAQAARRIGESFAVPFKRVGKSGPSKANIEVAVTWFKRAHDLVSESDVLPNPVRSHLIFNLAKTLREHGPCARAEAELAISSLYTFLDEKIQTNQRLLDSLHHEFRTLWNAETRKETRR